MGSQDIKWRTMPMPGFKPEKEQESKPVRLDTNSFRPYIEDRNYVPGEHKKFSLYDHFEEARKILFSDECILNKSDSEGRPFVSGSQITYSYLGQRLENGETAYSVCFQEGNNLIYMSRLMHQKDSTTFVEGIRDVLRVKGFKLVGGQKVGSLELVDSDDFGDLKDGILDE